ncbi:lipid-binding SYLF domain-containing protein [Sabulicella glaciei]|uniref:Lipid-binding SYLF domain-containing protein n=1 Tax=Sabulicella glaciei TaxID=2984948 RepID=A0ABT3NWF5_9PROT|nr:lipid-binding SYLF domain-containing protein [Roseococcus sp. MDT2-1-1]MCW8086485.1 lipid-binding SYLF domain-containing protein [Roseococcus sp. MDT2-1-1]
MRRWMIMAGAALLAACSATPQGTEPQVLVDRSALTVQEILGDGNDRLDAASLLRRARGALICPRSFRVAFFAGGEGGGCVLLGRDAAGSWSSPAFYGVGAGSIGFQAGIQDSQTLLLLMNERALNAIIDGQFKFGADASLAVAHVGGSVEAATTTALGADILSFSRSRGLFAGLAIEGAVVNAQPAWNSAYYGREVTPRDIVVNMVAHNPAADPLRGALLRFGQGSGARAMPAPAPMADVAPGPQPIVPMSAVPAAPTRRGPVTGGGGVSRAPLAPIR